MYVAREEIHLIGHAEPAIEQTVMHSICATSDQNLLVKCLFQDGIPFGDYTRKDGVLNFASFSSINGAFPDLGEMKYIFLYDQ